MEHPAKESTSGLKISSTISTGTEKNAWKLPGETFILNAPSDASLFSASLPFTRHETFNLSESKQRDQAVNDSFPNLSNVCEPSVVGGFLPGDEELLAGLMDDFDLSGLPSQLDDLEDDFFESGGGLEIEPEYQESLVNGVPKIATSDGSIASNLVPYGFVNSVGNVRGEHPYGEHPSRTLFVRNINSNVEDSELISLFEQYGDIRTLYTACKHRGFVMISYYDIRAARTAIRGLQNKPLRRRKLDIHFSIPKDNPSEKDVNQGTLVVFNLDASVSNDDLRQIFGAYGEVKEIRETPHKCHHKFIEFYDVRSADSALKALNRSDIAGKRIKLEPSRPGGARRSLVQQLSQEQEQDEYFAFRHQVDSPTANSPPGNWQKFGSPVEHHPFQGHSPTSHLSNISPVRSNYLPGLASILPSHISKPVKIAPIGKDPRRINLATNNTNTTHGPAYARHYSTYDQILSLSPYSQSSSVETLSGPQFLWGSRPIHSENINSSSLKGHGCHFASGGEGIGFPFTNQLGSFLGSRNHGSAPSGVNLERHFGFFPELPAKSFRGNNGNSVTNFEMAFARNFPESDSPSSRMVPLPRNSPLFFETSTFGGTNSIISDGLMDLGRIRRTESGFQVDNKRQYQLDLEKIVNGEDSRTTLMIKNIPNKYTSKMLLAAIDETHRGTYDFLYLPIDFKNKCNVGYAFINMLSPSHIFTFYKAFNGKKWEKFNSEKVASLAYARIQGKAGLVSHFQNSSLMNEDKRCRPIIFRLENQDTNDLEPIQSGNLNILIRHPDGSYTGDSIDSPTADSADKL